MRAPILVLTLFISTLATTINADSPRVTLETSMGKIVLELDQERAPQSVGNFLRYVDDGFYDGTVFHRVIDGFMIQGGGFTGELQRKPTHSPIQNEASNGLKNHRYTIAMARTQQPHSATSQFFINTEDNAFLDHKTPSGNGWGYAVFGKVVDGTGTVDAISTVDTGARGPLPGDVPLQNVTIMKASRTATP